MNKIKNIIIVNTYFHIRQLKFLDFINCDNSIVYYGHHIKQDIITKELPRFKIKELPKYKFSKNAFVKNLYQSIKDNRQLIKELKLYIEENIKKNIDKNKSYNLILFTEKELFNQIILSSFEKKNNIKKISVDEGIGHYRIAHSIKEKIINILYNFFSILFLNFKFNYVVSLGTDSRFDVIYLRFPNLLDLENNKKIKRIIVPTSSYISHNNNNILILTSPLSEDNFISIGEEKSIIHNIFNILQSNGYKIDVKPHPRELDGKYNNELRIIHLLDKEKPFESLDISHYKFILNFGSSIVLSLYENNFPLKNIITYEIINLDNYPLFNKTLMIKNFSELTQNMKVIDV